MLNQKERKPLEVGDQVASIYAGTSGLLDRIKTDRVPEFLEGLLERLHSENEELIQGITDDGKLADEDEEKLEAAIADAIDDFGPDFDKEGSPLEEGESERIRDESEREAPARTVGDEDETKDEESSDEKDDAGSDPSNDDASEEDDAAEGSDPSADKDSDEASDEQSEDEEEKSEEETEEAKA
jgi:ATP synthase alpha/beta chain, C terminal domain